MRARKVVIATVLTIGTLFAGGAAVGAPAALAAGHSAPQVYMHG
jgi:hypothetical protein